MDACPTTELIILDTNKDELKADEYTYLRDLTFLVGRFA
jgi:hypothetical protein